MATEQSQSQSQSRPVSQKLPAGLAGVLNPSDDNRDSAYYSSTDASSKRKFSLIAKGRSPAPASAPSSLQP